MIKSEPNAPTMVVKRDWKGEGDYQQHSYHQLIIRVDHDHGHSVSHQDRKFGGNDIDENGSNKEALLAFEVNLTGVASMLNLKWLLDDGTSSAGGAKQSQTAPACLSKRRRPFT